jgi:hypothetical protein
MTPLDLHPIHLASYSPRGTSYRGSGCAPAPPPSRHGREDAIPRRRARNRRRPDAAPGGRRWLVSSYGLNQDLTAPPEGPRGTGAAGRHPGPERSRHHARRARAPAPPRGGGRAPHPRRSRPRAHPAAAAQSSRPEAHDEGPLAPAWPQITPTGRSPGVSAGHGCRAAGGGRSRRRGERVESRPSPATEPSNPLVGSARALNANLRPGCRPSVARSDADHPWVPTPAYSRSRRELMAGR